MTFKCANGLLLQRFRKSLTRHHCVYSLRVLYHFIILLRAAYRYTGILFYMLEIISSLEKKICYCETLLARQLSDIFLAVSNSNHQHRCKHRNFGNSISNDYHIRLPKQKSRRWRYVEPLWTKNHIKSGEFHEYSLI